MIRLVLWVLVRDAFLGNGDSVIGHSLRDSVQDVGYTLDRLHVHHGDA